MKPPGRRRSPEGPGSLRRPGSRVAPSREPWSSLAFEAAPLGIVVVTGAGRIVAANRVFGALLGRDAEGLVGEGLLALIHAGDREDAERALQALWSGEATRAETERRYVHSSGSAVLTLESAAPLPASGGRPTAAVLQVQDIRGRREAAVLLQGREARLRLLVDQIPAVLWTTDEDLRLTSVPHRPFEHSDVEGVGTGSSLLDYFRTADPDFPAIAGHRRAVAGASVVLECEWLDRLFRMHVQPLRDAPQGRIVGTIGVASDITELKQTEEALRASELKFRSLLEAMGTAAFIFQGSGLAYANPAAERITGYAADELSRMAFWEIIHPEDRAQVRERGFARQEGKPVPSRYEVRILTKDGEERWMDYSGLVINYEGAPAVLGTAMDITQRKRAEAALRESEERFRTIFEKSPIGMALVDQEAELVDANEALCGMMGYNRQELRGTSIRRASHPDELARNLADFRLLGGDGSVLHDERRFVRKSGDAGWFRVTASTIHDPQGQVLWLAMIEDITDQRRSEREAREHRAQLGRVLRLHSLGELAAGLAHELNQPLAAVVSFARGCVHRARTGELSVEDLIGKLDQIAEEALRAGSIIKLVQRFLRNERPVREPVEIGRLLDNIARLVESEARQRGIDLRVEVPVGLPCVLAEAVQIEQVIFNLVRNAFEAVENTREGGSRVEIAVQACASGIEIHVHDTGPGVGPGDPERIFEPFYSSKAQGMGLGLSISRSIVQAHGGRLWVSESGAAGTTFRFTLPALPAGSGSWSAKGGT